jgi:hypothetical protein
MIDQHQSCHRFDHGHSPGEDTGIVTPPPLQFRVLKIKS